MGGFWRPQKLRIVAAAEHRTNYAPAGATTGRACFFLIATRRSRFDLLPEKYSCKVLRASLISGEARASSARMLIKPKRFRCPCMMRSHAHE